VEGDYYPGPAVERLLGVKFARRARAREAEFLGAPERDVDVVPVDDARIMHGRKIRPGVRPLLNVSRTSGFMPHLTERQRRRGKVRTARSWGRMLDTMKKTGMTLEEFVETLTPEELVRGRLRDSQGGFTGRPPAWVPREFHQACIRELMRRGRRLWQENYLDAIEAMVGIATGKVKGATAGDRLKAAQFVIERIEGKAPERPDVKDDSPWQAIIADIVTEVPDDYLEPARAARAELTGPVQEMVVEGEVVAEDPPSPRRPAARRSRRPQ